MWSYLIQHEGKEIDALSVIHQKYLIILSRLWNVARDYLRIWSLTYLTIRLVLVTPEDGIRIPHTSF
jgi:hypothetical protein